MQKKLSLFLFIFLFCTNTFATQDNPFGPNVVIFDQSMSPAQINGTINGIYNAQRFNEFGDNRYALLFMPGHYGTVGNEVDVRVGYYTQVLGLGQDPNEVLITGAVRTQDAIPHDPNHPDHAPGALTNFWRSCENLAVIPTLGSIDYPYAIPKDQNVWAVSQASPMRRVHILGTLRLFDLGWSSGGFLANSVVDNEIISGSQQQWLTRNSTFKYWNGGNWNMVFVGSEGSLNPGTWPTVPYTTIANTPVLREKPFLFSHTVNSKKEYAVMVPNLKNNTKGVDYTPGTIISINDFYIAKPNVDNAASINAALQQHKHLLFTPGVYHLEDTIRVNNANTVVLGIGLPTLIPDHGQVAMLVSDVDGIKVGGVLFDAGPNNSPALLKIGENVSGMNHSNNPIFLYDTFCRVGGAHPGVAQTCAIINSNDVVGDNFWLWRADHGADVGWYLNKSDTGLIVNGNSFTVYGLAVEHFQKYQVIWNGELGRTYFYQSEIPYDPPSQGEWMNGNINGYASYKISNNVLSHQAWGVGVYCYFKDANNIYEENAIESSTGCGNNGIQLTHLLTYWLDGNPNTGITHIINNTGDAVYPGHNKSTLNGWPDNSINSKNMAYTKKSIRH